MKYFFVNLFEKALIKCLCYISGIKNNLKFKLMYNEDLLIVFINKNGNI